MTKEEDNSCPSKINIFGGVSKSKVLSCIRKIIKTQPVLRTVYHPDTTRMNEYEYSDNWYIPYIEVDLEPDAVRQADSIIMMPQLFEWGSVTKLFAWVSVMQLAGYIVERVSGMN